MKLPASFQPYVFGLVLSGVMSFMVSGIATLNAVGFADGFFTKWIGSWVFAWAVAFPTLLVVRPFAQRFTAMIVASPEVPAR